MPTRPRADALAPGRMVALQGLVKRPDLNGAVGRVAVSEHPSEREALEASGRCKVLLCRGGSVSAKPSSLKPSRDTEWGCSGLHGVSIWEHILVPGKGKKKPRAMLGDEDRCDVFARRLWDSFFELPPPHSLHPFEGVRELLLSCTGHKLFWFSMDAVMHHFVLEHRDGRWRVHQTHICCRPGVGYTAAQWSTPFSPAMEGNEAHRNWGGGQELSSMQISPFLDIVGSLVALTDELLIEELLPQVPGWKGPEDNRKASSWAASQLDHLGSKGVTLSPMDTRGCLLPDCDAEVSMAGETLLIVTGPRAQRLESLWWRLTGMPMSGIILLRMVNYCFWKTSVDGSSLEWVGFTLRAADLGCSQTYEEGLRNVEKMRETAKADMMGRVAR